MKTILTFGLTQVVNKLRLPAVLNKFFQPIPISAEEFFSQWRSLAAPPLKLQEVVRIFSLMFFLQKLV